MVVVQAFSLEQAARLTGITVAQLKSWDRTGFFSPSLATENRKEPYSRVYSFQDIASLKVISILRNETKVSLQHLREVGRKLSSLGQNSWAKITLYVLKKRVVFYNPDTDKKEEIVSGQVVLDIPLEIVRSSMKAAVERERTRSSDDIGRLEKKKFYAHSRVVVAGTRIPVSTILAFMRANYSDSQIIAEYPILTVSDLDMVRRTGMAA